MGKKSSGDRISNLPEDVRVQILSFLSTSDALGTSLLSSTWRYVWTGLPFFDFGKEFWKNSKYSQPIDNYLDANQLYHDIYDDFDNGKDEGYLIDYADTSLRTWSLGFVLFLDQIIRILKKHPYNQTRKLRLFLPNDASLDAGVSMDIAFTNANELQGLSDFIRDNRRTGGYRFRFKLSRYLIASSNSLIELNLGVFNMFNQSEERMPIKLPFLRKLSMNSDKGEIDQGVFEYLLRSCSTTLEELHLQSHNRNSRLLQVYGFPKLRVLQIRISKLKNLKIDAPDLHSLSLAYLPAQRSVVNWASLVKLKLEYCDLTKGFFDDGLVSFARLESLHISACCRLTHIKIWSISLTNLVISSCPDLTQIETDTPNLKSFSLYTTVIVSLLCKNPIAPQNAFIFFDSYSKYTEWLTKFVQCQTSAFYGPGNEGMIIPQELRVSSSPLLWGVERLHVFLNFQCPPTKHEFLQYMDVVLQLSPHPKTFVLSTTRYVKQDNDWNLVGHENRSGHIKLELEFQYKEEAGEFENSCGCCPCQPINCWRHSLMDFKIKKHKGLGDAANVRRFFQDVLAGKRK